MVKDDTILMLAALGVGAAILYKPLQATGGAISDTVSGVGSGLSTGVQGVGAGVSSAFTGTGEAVGETALGVSSIFGYVDQVMAAQEERSQLKAESQAEELAKYYELLAEEKTVKQEGDVEQALLKETGKTEREAIEQAAKVERESQREEFKTSWTDFLTPTPGEIYSGASSLARYVQDKYFKKKKKEEKIDPQKQEIAQKFQSGDLDIWEAFGQLEGREIKRPVTPIGRIRKQAERSPELQANLEKLGWADPKQEKKSSRSSKTTARNSSKKATGSSSGLRISKVKNWGSLSSSAKRKLKSIGYS